MNLLRKTTLIVTAGMALCCAVSLPAQANRLKPHHYAYAQLHYGIARELYDAGCLTWNYRTQSWYTHCGLPQDAVLYRPRVISVRD